MDALERAIEAGSMVQPFVEDVKVRIDRSRLRGKTGRFDYVSLTGEMLDVKLMIGYKGTKVHAGMKFVKEMEYPLMFLESVQRERD